MNPHLRWAALVPSAIVAWFLAAVITYAAWVVAIQFCPPELFISGTCMAPWFNELEQGLLYFGVALSGVLVVALPSVVAPSHKSRVAWGALAIGAMVAIAIGREIHAYTVIPILTGAFVAVLVSWRVRRHDA